ncbi:MAG: beta-ketoacyl synthase chain length factor [Myxococcales bacterium FL481]|nr:MAG: beta-ketoacyl synthase chain length factor [Myxococcales bacterium FL481]
MTHATPPAAGAFECWVTGVDIWSPGFANAGAWTARVRDASVVAASGEGLDARTRRRASKLARALANVATSVLEQSGGDRATVPAVFGSALGEASTMLKLLDQMLRTQEELSPMHFAMSVHNAASGLWSIAGQNRGFTTSLAADHDTPAMMLVETIGLLATLGGPVVLASGDDAAPDQLIPADQRFDLLAVGLALEAGDCTPHAPALAKVRGPWIQRVAWPADVMPGPLRRNPQAGLLNLADAVLRRRAGLVALDTGEGRGYCVEVEPT